MLKNAFQKMVGGKTEINSAQLFLLQTKSYRLLKNKISPLLYKHGISTLEWSFLGVVKTCTPKCRYVDLSYSMGVEPPFVTALVTKIQSEKLIKIIPDPEDRRAKVVVLSSKGIALIEKLEPQIDKCLQEILRPLSASDFNGYVGSMTIIAESLKPSK